MHINSTTGWQPGTLLSSKMLRGGLLAITIAVLATYVFQSIAYEAFNYVEFEIVSFSLIWARSSPPYADLSTEIAPIGFYSPLCYFIPALIGRISRVTDSPENFLLVFRFIILGYILGSGVLLHRLALQLSGNRNLALATVSVLLGPWAVLGARPDWQALFFALAALYLLLREGAEEKSSHCAAAAGVLLAISFLHYQKEVSLPLAAALWLFLTGKKLRTTQLLLCFLSVSLLVLLIVWAVTGGRLLTHSFVIPYLTSALKRTPTQMVELVGWKFLLLAIAGSCFYWVPGKKGLSAPEYLLGIYGIVCSAATIFFLRSMGAAGNQLLELAAVAGLLTAAAAGRCLTGSRPRRIIGVMIAGVLLFFPLNNGFDVLRYWRAELMGIRGRYDSTVGHEKNLATLPQGPMLSDDTTLPYKTNHPETANETWYFTRVLIPMKIFDPGPTAQKIREQRYASIVLREQELYSLFENEIEAHYRPSETFSPYQVWRRKE